MGEITEVDPGGLRATADRVMHAADSIAGISWPALNPDELPGSSMARSAPSDLVAARLAEVVADMRGWAQAARSSADAFERADGEAARRLPSR